MLLTASGLASLRPVATDKRLEGSVEKVSRAEGGCWLIKVVKIGQRKLVVVRIAVLTRHGGGPRGGLLWVAIKAWLFPTNFCRPYPDDTRQLPYSSRDWKDSPATGGTFAVQACPREHRARPFEPEPLERYSCQSGR